MGLPDRLARYLVAVILTGWHAYASKDFMILGKTVFHKI